MAKKLLFLLTFLAFFFPARALAHDFAPDGNIRAVIHIDPQDEPVAGSASTIHIDLVDQEKKFAYENCICTLSISKNGEEIFSTEIHDDMGHMPVVSYIFPKKGMYQIQVIGQPISEPSFEEFNLSYDIVVNQQDMSKQPETPTLLFIVFLALAGVAILLSWKLLYHKSNKK